MPAVRKGNRRRAPERVAASVLDSKSDDLDCKPEVAVPPPGSDSESRTAVTRARVSRRLQGAHQPVEQVDKGRGVHHVKREQDLVAEIHANRDDVNEVDARRHSPHIPQVWYQNALPIADDHPNTEPPQLRTIKHNNSRPARKPATPAQAAMRVAIPIPNMPNVARARIHQQDLDDKGLFQLSVMQLPANVTRQMREGWPYHIPLDYLTTDDSGRFVTVQGPEQSPMKSADSDDSMGSSIQPLMSFSESSMEYRDWVQAYPRLLQLIRDFYPGPDYAELSAAFRTHFNRLCGDPMLHEMWPAFLAYDIRMRELFSSHGVFPNVVQENIFEKEKLQFILTATALRALNEGFRSSGDVSPRSARYEDDDNQYDSQQCRSSVRHSSHPYSGQSHHTPMFCVLCGNAGHPARDCNSPMNQSLCRNDDNDWVLSNGRQFCYNWNGHPSICKNRRQGCHRIHACTLCGATGHYARICRLARL